MVVTAASSLYRGHRFPDEIIAHCVWLYFRFCLSFRDVQEMMLERGVEVSMKAFACGPSSGTTMPTSCAGGARPGDNWHLDEVF